MSRKSIEISAFLWCQCCKYVTKHEKRAPDICCTECHYIAITEHCDPATHDEQEKQAGMKDKLREYTDAHAKEAVIAALNPLLSAGTFEAPDWAIRVAAICMDCNDSWIAQASDAHPPAHAAQFGRVDLVKGLMAYTSVASSRVETKSVVSTNQANDVDKDEPAQPADSGRVSDEDVERVIASVSHVNTDGMDGDSWDRILVRAAIQGERHDC